jgi:hypothetical protein
VLKTKQMYEKGVMLKAKQQMKCYDVCVSLRTGTSRDSDLCRLASNLLSLTHATQDARYYYHILPWEQCELCPEILERVLACHFICSPDTTKRV